MGMGVGEQVRKIELDAYTMFMKATAITGLSRDRVIVVQGRDQLTGHVG